MNNNKPEPVLPQIIKDWKNKKVIEKNKEIELLRLEIEKAKLEKELKEIRGKK